MVEITNFSLRRKYVEGKVEESNIVGLLFTSDISDCTLY